MEIPVSGGVRRLALHADLLKAIEERIRTWRTLQELAGLVTPFTERIHNEIETTLTTVKNAEVATIQAAADARVQAVENEYEDLAIRRVRDSLLALTGLPVTPAAVLSGVWRPAPDTE